MVGDVSEISSQDYTASDETDDEEINDFNDSVFNYVATWPSPIPVYMRIDLVRNGTRLLQHKQSPFHEVDGWSLSTSWFQNNMPNGQKVERSWLIYSMKKQAAFCFPCLLFPA